MDMGGRISIPETLQAIPHYEKSVLPALLSQRADIGAEWQAANF
jgi:hypothetical protein